MSELKATEEQLVENFTIEKLSRDLRKAATDLGIHEARYFVDTYYDIQKFRTASANRQRKLLKNAEPNEFMRWLTNTLLALEGQIQVILDKWSAVQPMGIWAREVIGIGPVFASGLVANINIAVCPTAGHIWSYAGLNPEQEWKKGEIRPFNANLKRLCWLIGESFVKVSGHKDDFYGKEYLKRKHYEELKNERFEYREECIRRCKEDDARPPKKKLDKELRALLETGKLPQKAMHERSKRWAVKLFLAHWFEEAYRLHFKREPPLPYPIAILGHAHIIAGPHSKPKPRPKRKAAAQ